MALIGPASKSQCTNLSRCTISNKSRSLQRASCSSCVVQMGFSGVVSLSIYSTQRAKVSKEVMNHRGSRGAGLYFTIRITP
jgi:hypothetical protein